MNFMMNEQGSFELYDDTYDVVIHCDSEKAHNEVLADLKAINDRFDVLDKIRSEIVQKHLSIAEQNDFQSGRTYAYEEVLDIIDKYISRK